MAEDDVLRRIERRMQRTDEFMEGQAEFMRDQRDFMRDQRDFMRDQAVFMRELTVRNEKFTRGVVGELKDLQDQTKAQTQAILRVLDRLQPSG